MSDPRRGPGGRPPAPIRWWEARATGSQIRIAMPVFSVALFSVNVLVFNQPLPRSIFYGVFEGAMFTGLALVATRNEKARRG